MNSLSLFSTLLQFIVGLLRRTWLVAIVTVVVCASFAASAVASLLAAEHLADAPHSTVPAVMPSPPTPARVKPDASGFVARNIFCSSCQPAAGSPSETGRYAGEPAILIATMLGHDARATVRVLATEAQGSWGVGDRIPGVGLIDRIGATSIDVLDAAGGRGRISLLDAAAGGRDATAGAATPAAATPADPFADRVRKLSDSTYEVERDLVRELVSGATKPGGARAVPVITNGDVKGVRLLGVRGGSVASALGLKSNDVIAAIDGAPIKNVQQLLDLYARLDDISTVELSGTRAGKPLGLTLRLR